MVVCGNNKQSMVDSKKIQCRDRQIARRLWGDTKTLGSKSRLNTYIVLYCAPSRLQPVFVHNQGKTRCHRPPRYAWVAGDVFCLVLYLVAASYCWARVHNTRLSSLSPTLAVSHNFLTHSFNITEFVLDLIQRKRTNNQHTFNIYPTNKQDKYGHKQWPHFTLD